ncbi:MAG: M23 family metallopeptidase [Alphaproteobacteria bacterium]|nr:M23 family metallopeptidase [Alphaproteobacteria bacterium]
MWLLLLACAPDPTPVDSVAPVDDTLRGPVAFALPLAEPERFDQVVGVDHDPVDREGLERLICFDYAERGFPWCYDGHRGSDYLLVDGWAAMDAGSTPVLAAADGVVTRVVDGNYDRCHGDLSSGAVSCDGNPVVANRVEVEHEGGHVSAYLHLAKDSVLVEVGQAVTCGEVLGLVGSSGNSSQPHLHFEVWSAEGEVVDPYAGPASQAETWWWAQGDLEGLPGAECAP